MYSLERPASLHYSFGLAVITIFGALCVCGLAVNHIACLETILNSDTNLSHQGVPPRRVRNMPMNAWFGGQPQHDSRPNSSYMASQMLVGQRQYTNNAVVNQGYVEQEEIFMNGHDNPTGQNRHNSYVVPSQPMKGVNINPSRPVASQMIVGIPAMGSRYFIGSQTINQQYTDALNQQLRDQNTDVPSQPIRKQHADTHNPTNGEVFPDTLSPMRRESQHTFSTRPAGSQRVSFDLTQEQVIMDYTNA